MSLPGARSCNACKVGMHMIRDCVWPGLQASPCVLAALRCWPLCAGIWGYPICSCCGIPNACCWEMVYGLGIGFNLHAAPAYLAGVGHPRIRGLLIR